jgi:response regulator RpfG family c-di-GMP phosphodiesterase
MKIGRETNQPQAKERPSRSPPWKVLVVDDEPDIRRLTKLNLRGFQFAGRGLELIEAGSAAEAMDKLHEHDDIAAALIDVVMETDDAGLKLVEHIRNQLNNRQIRLIIRTGQPGVAPEHFVIDHFDINDYKDKTELTSQRLYTTLRTAIKGYRDLQTIEINRLGLARILDVTPGLYDLRQEDLEEYFRGVLMQIIGICNLEHSGIISTIDGLVVTLEGENVQIRAGTGEFEQNKSGNSRRNDIVELCSRSFISHESPQGLRKGALIVPLRVNTEVLGFVYLESQTELTSGDRELIQVMANQCAAALDNFRLHHSLEEAYEEAIDMLGIIAEFRDSATGSHIRRIREYTRRVAKALGCSDDEANTFAKASLLHDVGKVGIPDYILRKDGTLTDEEYTLMKRHTQIGDAVLSRSPSLSLARMIAMSHHEHWDGSGYPNGLSGSQIPYAARLVAVVDVFDALISHRSYKGGWIAKTAATEIAEASGSHFDPQVADAFLKLYRDGHLDDLIASSSKPGQVA